MNDPRRRQRLILGSVVVVAVLVAAYILLPKPQLPQESSTGRQVTVETESEVIEVHDTGVVWIRDGSTERRAVREKREAEDFIRTIVSEMREGMPADTDSYRVVVRINGNTGTGQVDSQTANTLLDTLENAVDGSGSSDTVYAQLFPTPTRRSIRITPTLGVQPTVDDCPFWRLSYCVYPWPTTVPVVSVTPTPTTNPYPNLKFDCTLGGSQVTSRTVISDTVCISEE